MTERQVVRTFWHGAALTAWERLSIQSFLQAGHPVELYSYSELQVPRGAMVCAASEILPERDVFAYKKGWAKGKFTAFSNIFRYALLHKKGGIWADLDVLCLKALDLPPSTIGWENHDAVNGAVMSFPPEHPFTAELYERAASLGKDISLGEAGPMLLTTLIQERQRHLNIMPTRCFYPIHWSEAWKLVDPTFADECRERTAESFCVHWWNGAIRGMGFPDSLLPPEGSFLCQAARMLLASEDLELIALDEARRLLAARFQPALDPAAEKCRLQVASLEQLLFELEGEIPRIGDKLRHATRLRLDWWLEKYASQESEHSRVPTTGSPFVRLVRLLRRA